MHWLWRKETALWEGFEGIWSPFRLESVVKFLAWGQCHHPWHTSGSLLWGTNTGWPTPRLNFRALLGSLHLCSQQSPYPQNQGLSLSLSLSWHGCGDAAGSSSPSTGAGAGSQGLGSQSLHSWHSTESRPSLERPLLTWAVTSPGYYPAGIFLPPSAQDIFCQSSCTGWTRVSEKLNTGTTE